jgi:glycosyltransferase involved in cell wall biosynthesis
LHATSFEGGVLNVLRQGVPYLAELGVLRLTLADIYGRCSLFEEVRASNLRFDASIGIPGKVSITRENGLQGKLNLCSDAIRHLRITIQIARRIREFNAIYVHVYKDLLLAQLARALAASSIPIVWHCHGMADSDVPVPRGLVLLANRCSKILAVSRSAADRLVEIGVSQDRIQVIHNALDSARIRSAPELPPSHPLLLARDVVKILIPSATLRKQKGMHLAIQALPSLPENTQLWLTGDTDDRAGSAYISELRQMASDLRVSNRVVFLGFRRDIHSVMKAVDVVCLPSICREGFALVVAEAAVLGKPVVASNRGGIPEVVSGLESAIIFNPDIPGELAEKLSVCIDNLNHLSLVAEQSRDQVSRRFAYGDWASRVADELTEACDEGS